MVILNVPFVEKGSAKSLGAKWDTVEKTWYVPDGISPAPFSRWFFVEQAPAFLYVDLVPRSAWFSNLRSELTPQEWEAVKRIVFTMARNRCQVCGGHGPDHPVECHERWSYNEETGIQSLIGLVAHCPACHQATHIGSARVLGRFVEAKDHLKSVNKWSEEQTSEHIETAFEDWLRRSEMSWALDATWLFDFPVDLSATTRLKIDEHAQQLRDRDIATWQEEVQARQVPKLSSVSHYFSEDD